MIAFAWNEPPEYGARLLARARRDFVAAHGGELPPVIANPPQVPVEGLEEILGPIHWIDADSRLGWHDLGLEVPRVLVMMGWRYPHFVRLAREVRASGGRVVGMFDNCWKGTLRQRVGRWVMGWWLRRAFSAVLVPGRSGRRFVEYLGFEPERVHEGLYGADSEVFVPGPPLVERPRTLLYVGQFIERKRVRELLEAFELVRGVGGGVGGGDAGSGGLGAGAERVVVAERVVAEGVVAEGDASGAAWTLELMGQGPALSAADVASGEGVVVRPFAQVADVAAAMRRSRVLVLPSYEDHWGVVVHEACLSGCAIVTTDGVAAAQDLVNPHPPAANGVVTDRNSVADLARGLREVMAWSDAQWEAAEAESLRRAEAFGPAVYSAAVERAVGWVGG